MKGCRCSWAAGPVRRGGDEWWVGGVAPGSFVLKPERKRKREEGSTRVLERRKGGGSNHSGPWRKERGTGPLSCGRAALAAGQQQRVRVR
jgi:hypothetical protein